MDVRIDTQRRGIVHPIPRPGDGQELAARGSLEPHRDSHPQTKPASGAPAFGGTAGDHESGAWFDANGDGVIESWSYAHGGDSFANFTPPPPRSTGPTGRHGSDTPSTTPNVKTPERADASPGTPAAMHHAHAAYRRDGLSNAPVAHHSGSDPRPAASSPPVSVPAASVPTPR